MLTLYRKVSYLLSAREKRNASVLFALMIVGALFEVVGVGAIPAFVGVISMPERLLEVGAVRAAYEWLGLTSTQQMVFWAALALIVVFVTKNIYLAFLEYVRARYVSNRQVSVSTRLFDAYLHAPYTFHLQRNTAVLLRNTSSEAGAVVSSVIIPAMGLFMEAMVLVFIFVLLVVVEPLVTMGTFVIFGGITVVFYRATRARIDVYADREQHHRGQSLKAVNQGLGGLKDARVLGREGFFLAAYRESAQFMARAAQFKAVVSALPRLFLETMAVVALLGVSALLVAQDRPLETIMPTLTLLAVAVVRLMPSFTRIAGFTTLIKWGTIALNKVYDDLEQLDRERAEARDEGYGEALPFHESLQIESLWYRYPNAPTQSLENVTLTIPKNASVGFIGSSGAGKTTIVDVVLGLLTPREGRVLVDSVDIQGRLSAWRRKIGYIPQSIYLTDDSVRRNVAFGVDAEEIDDDAVWAALEAAQLRELVESMDGGLDAVVGERGVRLSGGQRQRIGIARALYHDPEVIVMDEATSALDNQTERNFVEALEQLQGERTLLIIAHRLSTVRNCDTLFMLEGGRLVAQGSYDELMSQSEAFRRMAGTVAPDPAIV